MVDLEYLRDRLDSAIDRDADAVLVKTSELYEVVAFLNAIGTEGEKCETV